MCALPSLRWLLRGEPDGALYGYTDTMPARPQNFQAAYFDRSLQRWAERYFDVHLGFRAALIRSFNEVNFALFREAPRLNLFSTPEKGLYSRMSIDSLNGEIRQRSEWQAVYQVHAQKLLRLQALIEAQGKHFQVVIASSKPYVYPDALGDKFLLGGGAQAFARAASFGEALQKQGVHVIDSGPMLRDVMAKTGLQTHPDAGVHWNYYAGCLVARRLIENIRPTDNRPGITVIECLPKLAQPQGIDADGLSLLNVWSNGGLNAPTPFPQIPKPASSLARQPRMVFVGDSFSDQIRYALKQGGAYSHLVMSGYFRTREVDDALGGTVVAPDNHANEAEVRATLTQDIAASDVVVLQMVDYNVIHLGFGLADYLLEHGLGDGSLQITQTTGAFERETVGAEWWHWVGKKVTFSFKPTLRSEKGKQSQLRFLYGTRGKQTITVQVQGRDGSTQRVLASGAADAYVPFDATINLPPDQIESISFETSGAASPLGNGDPRLVAWRIGNVTVKPL